MCGKNVQNKSGVIIWCRTQQVSTKTWIGSCAYSNLVIFPWFKLHALVFVRSHILSTNDNRQRLHVGMRSQFCFPIWYSISNKNIDIASRIRLGMNKIEEKERKKRKKHKNTLKINDVYCENMKKMKNNNMIKQNTESLHIIIYKLWITNNKSANQIDLCSQITFGNSEGINIGSQFYLVYSVPNFKLWSKKRSS